MIWRLGYFADFWILETGVMEHLSKKKMFSFGHCPNGGGEGPARIKKHNIYIYSFLTAEKMYKLPERGGRGGERGNSVMPQRKHSFF